MEIKRRDEDEKKRRSLDAKKLKKLKQKNLPKALELINKNENPMVGINTRLSLPAPQINDNELEMIKRYAAGTIESGALGSTADSSATRALMGNYSQRDVLPATPATGLGALGMGGKTPLMSERIMQEAKNALYYRSS